MDLKEKKSKVALCKKCGGYILASHTDYIRKESEKEFTQFTNEGYQVKIETLEKTRSRNLVFYSKDKNGKCEDCNKPKK
jgi:hypothetical protein